MLRRCTVAVLLVAVAGCQSGAEREARRVDRQTVGSGEDLEDFAEA